MSAKYRLPDKVVDAGELRPVELSLIASGKELQRLNVEIVCEKLESRDPKTLDGSPKASLAPAFDPGEACPLAKGDWAKPLT